MDNIMNNIWDNTQILIDMKKEIETMKKEIKELQRQVNILDRDRIHHNWRA